MPVNPGLDCIEGHLQDLLYVAQHMEFKAALSAATLTCAASPPIPESQMPFKHWKTLGFSPQFLA